MYQQFIQWLSQHQLPCLFKLTFGIDCPGCGIQRSFIALLQGHIWESIQLYPALLPILSFLIYLAINRIYRYRFSINITRAGIAFIFSIILVSYILKISTHSTL